MDRLALVVSLALAACSHPEPRPMAQLAPPAPAFVPSEHEGPVDVGAVKLWVRETAVARAATATIVTLHGGPGISHEYMLPFEVLRSETTRVVSYDQRGVGRSTAPADRDLYRFEDQAVDLEELRVHLGADKLDLVGHSYGGLVAMEYAIEFPNRVRSLILVDTMPPKFGDYMAGQWYFGQTESELTQQGIVPNPLPAIEGDDCAKWLVALMPVYFFDRAHPMTKHLAHSTCQVGVGEATLTANENYDLAKRLADVKVPTLVVHGEADPFRRQMADATVAAMTGAPTKLELIAKCGHVPFEECPDRFFAIVRDFLASRP